MADRPLRIAFHALDLANTFNELLLQGVSDGCRETGVELLAVNGGQLSSTHRFEAARNYLYDLPSPELFDGLLLADIYSFLAPDEQERARRTPEGRPVILINQRSAQVPHVVVDNKAGLRTLVQHLIDGGARRFAAVTGPATNHDTRERMECLKDVLSASGLSLPPDHVVVKAFAYPDGAQAVEELLDVRRVGFDALVCFNDNMALSALAELTRRGIAVPQDIQVTGFDNTEESRSTLPPLTTVNFPVYELGKQSVHLLVNWLRGSPPPLTTTIQSSFVGRESTRQEAVPESGGPWPAVGSGRTNEAELADLYFASARVALDRSHRQRVLQLVGYLLASARGTNPETEFLEALVVFLRRGGDPLPWVTMATHCARLVAAQSPTPSRPDLSAWHRRTTARVAELRDQNVINGTIYQRQGLLRAIELGESLLTDLDLVEDAALLTQELQELGFRSFAVVRFCGPSVTEGARRRQARLEFGYGLPARMVAGRAFSTSDLLPGGLDDVSERLMVDALHIRDHAIGYLVYPVANHSGLLFKSLRHQFSTALKTANLLSEVRALNQDLEIRIEERTRDWKTELVQRAQMEQELLKQRNLDSLGVLAAGLAHDFNNFLTGIMGNVSLLETSEAVSPETLVVLGDILKAAERARQVTRQLVTFSRGGSPLLQPTSLPGLLRETTDFILRGSSVSVHYQFPPDMSEVAVDSIQISQVIANLVLNAVQALAEQTTPVPCIELILTRERGPEGERAVLLVRDNGPGMDADHVAHLFTPWFTTKTTGTGLGLATCRSILERHGGGIEALSSPGAGTTMRLWVPLDEATPVHAPQPVPALPSPNPLRVLVLDDDPAVLQVLERMLVHLGHRAKGVTRGEQALSLFHEAARQGDPFQVVIFDLEASPGQDGKTTLEQLRGEYLGLRALVSSGFPTSAESSRLLGRLAKPYTLGGLQEALATVFR